MKSLSWFRLYGEFATDPVVQSLAFDDQRHFIMFLCFKSTGLLDREFGNPQTRLEVIRKAIGLDGKAWDEMRARLAACGLVDGDLQPTNWDKRQFVSDRDPTVNERVKKWRENKRLERENGAKRQCNGRVTDEKRSPETETETDKDVDLRSMSSPVPGKDVPRCPADEILGLYHQTLPVLPRVVALSDKRKRLLSSRWREVVVEDGLDRAEGIEFFRRYFTKVAGSRFLTGKVASKGDRSPFKADFEWLLLPSNFIKVVEGRYE